MKNGIILYEGPSVIDGEPIVAIATGIVRPSVNIKTGPMIQVFFLRSDMHPFEAVHRGADRSICGSCAHMGRIVENPVSRQPMNVERSCYVVVMHSPAIVYRAFKEGLYEGVSPAIAARYFRGRAVRLGAYGDPACTPFSILEAACAKADLVTGYTHSWADHPELAALCMASVDTEEERETAHRLGFRTFRVRSKDDPPLSGEGHCPASAEMGKSTMCFLCGLCGGQKTGAKADITVLAHGNGAAHFERRARALA